MKATIIVSVPLRGNVNNDAYIGPVNGVTVDSFRPLTGKCK